MGQQRPYQIVAETIWRAEYRRATGKERSIPWSEVSRDDQKKYEYLAKAVLNALYNASGD